jgi:hypothetical protein
MSKRIWLNSLVAGAAALTLFSGTASAATVVEVDTKQGISWVEATVDTKAEKVQIRILAPTRARGKQLWQTCRFSSSLPGTYRCGMDTSAGSLAQKRKGTWLAKVLIDGTKVASERFTF